MKKTKQNCTSISLSTRVKRRLDVVAELGRRSKTATVDLLIDNYLRDNPTLKSVVDNRMERTK